MAKYDLTPKISQYMDRHMVLPLLQFLQEKKIYDPKDLSKAKLQLISKTKMVDSMADEYKELHNTDTIPAALEEQRQEVYRQLKEWAEACGPLRDVVDDADLVNDMRNEDSFNLQSLKANYNVTEEHVEHLYRLGKLNFDCGAYEVAANYLFYFRLLSKDQEKNFWALWGKLAAETLFANFDAALEDLNALREAIDARVFADPLDQLQQRTWLIHWSLFIFFNVPNGLNLMIDFLLQDKLMNALQTNCPHMLRYLSAAVIINKRRRNVMMDVVKVLVQERESYSDPVTEFLRVLFAEFDFDNARAQLKLCEELLAHEFFLVAISDELLENARLLVFETYTRLHKSIDINVLGGVLELKSEDAAERKIVELIRDVRAHAKIDSASNHLLLSRQFPSIYQQVIEKTKSLGYRSTQLVAAVDKRIAAKLADQSAE